MPVEISHDESTGKNSFNRMVGAKEIQSEWMVSKD